MPKLSAAIVVLFAVIVTLLTINTGNANASVISPTRHACIAFAQWNHHKTSHNLSLAVRTARHASATIRTDITVVAYDVTHNYYLDQPADIAGTLQDCSHAR